ncbi:MAG: hypothetical protein RLZZ28_63 [Bacteroidota bacterium]
MLFFKGKLIAACRYDFQCSKTQWEYPKNMAYIVVINTVRLPGTVSKLYN